MSVSLFQGTMSRSPSSGLVPVLGGGSPTDYRKKGALVRTSPLEDLDVEWSTVLGVHSSFFPTIVLSKNRSLFPLGVWFSGQIRIPGRNGEVSPRTVS